MAGLSTTAPATTLSATTPAPAFDESVVATAAGAAIGDCQQSLNPASIEATAAAAAEGVYCALDTTPFVLLVLTIMLLCIQIVTSASQLYDRYKPSAGCGSNCCRGLRGSDFTNGNGNNGNGRLRTTNLDGPLPNVRLGESNNNSGSGSYYRPHDTRSIGSLS